MSKVLVTTDYSTNSKAAIRFAIQFAAQLKCELVFYHIYEGLSDDSWNIVEGAQVGGGSPDDRVNKLNKYITTIYKSHDKRPGKYTCVVESGLDIVGMIQEYAKRHACDYICISTRGGGVMNKLLGTTTSSVILDSPTPVIVVPKTYRIKPIKDVWYASDLSTLKSELTAVQQFAKPFKADVHVYHYDYMIELNEVLTKLNKIASKHITKGTFFHFRKMQIDKTISQHLQRDMIKYKPSLVVLFTRQNRNWFDRLFNRTNSKEVTFDTKAPLLILRKKST
jgi:nucleotide-binding universal stress UspA family protein